MDIADPKQIDVLSRNIWLVLKWKSKWKDSEKSGHWPIKESAEKAISGFEVWKKIDFQSDVSGNSGLSWRYKGICETLAHKKGQGTGAVKKQK